MSKCEPMRPVPVFRPDISEEVVQAVAEALRSRWLGPGPGVAAFESAFASFTGSAEAVSTSTGTAALKIALLAAGVGPGCEVIVPSFTWISIFHVVIGLGAVPVFADVEPAYLTLDAADVSRRITRRTRAVVTVHHGGQLSDLHALGMLARDAGVALIEDAAHACGAFWDSRPVGGTGSTATCFSFNAMKNLAIGDGGMMVTSNPELAQKAARYRSLGIDRDTFSRYGSGSGPSSKPWDYDVVSDGDRLHMNDISAAAGLVQLRRLPAGNSRRAEIATRYAEELSDVPGFRTIEARPNTIPSWHMFTVLMPNRDEFVRMMRHRGVMIGVHYRPIHLFDFCRQYTTDLPVTEDVWRNVTSFPMYTELTSDDQDFVIESARELAADLSGQTLQYFHRAASSRSA